MPRKVTKKEDSESHIYEHPKFGKVQSVTTILAATIPKPQLMWWASKASAAHIETWAKANAFDGQRGFIQEKVVSLGSLMGEVAKASRAHLSLSKDATSVGTKAHDAVEFFLKHQAWPRMTDDVALAVAGFEEFANAVNLKPLATEQRVFGPDMPYAGRYDLKGKVRDSTYVLDYKTSKAVYDEYAIQLAAYAKPQDISNIGVIRLAKDQPFVEFVDFSRVFDCAWEIWKALFESHIKMKNLVKEIKGMSVGAEVYERCTG